jgi:microcystin-dependent protein
MIWIKKVATTPLAAVAKVIDTLQTQTNERLNAPSIRAVRDGLADKWKDIYPVGSIYMSVNNVNPSTMFGGTWEQIKDKFLLACGDTYNNGATGGEANHTLTSNEIPSHNHSYTKATGVDNHTLTNSEMPSHSHVYNAVWVDNSPVESDTGERAFEWQFGRVESGETMYQLYLHQRSSDPFLETHTKGGGGSHNHGLSSSSDNTGNKGGGTSHNNMPPYLAVNVWVRTA